jgi:hypothetical protein
VREGQDTEEDVATCRGGEGKGGGGSKADQERRQGQEDSERRELGSEADRERGQGQEDGERELDADMLENSSGGGYKF